MSDPVLCAFEVHDNPGKYNVWRYDTPSTICVLWCQKADSEEQAKDKALALTKIQESDR